MKVTIEEIIKAFDYQSFFELYKVDDDVCIEFSDEGREMLFKVIDQAIKEDVLAHKNVPKEDKNGS